MINIIPFFETSSFHVVLQCIQFVLTGTMCIFSILDCDIMNANLKQKTKSVSVHPIKNKLRVTSNRIADSLVKSENWLPRIYIYYGWLFGYEFKRFQTKVFLRAIWLNQWTKSSLNKHVITSSQFPRRVLNKELITLPSLIALPEEINNNQDE